MNYELAKQLKDAGFPQKQEGEYITPSGNLYIGKVGCCCCDDHAYVPTLSELIEACGRKFLWLKKNYDTGEWFAEAYGLGIVHYSSTPEEAVGRLWLSLNSPSAKPL